MAATVEAIEANIRAALAPGFREQLLARGQARSIIWRDGVLPEDSPPFSPTLSYDLLSYGYSLLDLGIRLLELGGNPDVARLAFENAAGAIEAVIAKGDPNDPARDFHNVVAASAYHLGRFSARAYSLLLRTLEGNASRVERCLSLLMLRNVGGLRQLIADWRIIGEGDDQRLTEALESIDPQVTGDGDTATEVLDVLDIALTDNFMTAMSVNLLALERGDSALVEQAIIRLQQGLISSADLNFVPQWWAHKLAIHLLRDLWDTSFHVRLPLLPAQPQSPKWQELRRLYISVLYRRPKSEIDLWPSQLDAAVRAVGTNEDLVVSLPTSAGKTRIAELCILRCLASGQRVIFVTPLRALSAQTELALQRTFVPLGKSISTLYGSIGTGALEEDVLRKCDIVVATPEKLDFALRNDPSLINDVGLVILDEGHMIGLEEREIRYEVQIQRLLRRQDATQRRIVCLSAILASGDQLDDFASWLTRDRPDGLIQSDWRPTRLRFGEIAWHNQAGQLDIQVGAERPWVRKFLVAREPPLGQRTKLFPKDQRELCLAAAWRFIEDGQTVLIFCPLRKSVEPFAEAIVDLNKRGLLPSVLGDKEPALTTAFAIGREWLGQDHAILRCLKLGVAIHHGALPTPFRKEVERLLRDGILKLTISSPTLAQGLNLSATTLIFHGLERNRELIDVSEFKNVVGRAGRAYIDVEGLAVYPMFDNHWARQGKWRKLVADTAGRHLESGLVRLVATLLVRMQKKIGTNSLNDLVDYVVNNADAWKFHKLPQESPDVSEFERRRWEGHLTNLDTAILSLLGEADVSDADIEVKLDEVLSSSLWERRLARRPENAKKIIKLTLHQRAKHVWQRSTAVQRRGYFLAGVGLETGHQLDTVASEAEQLLVDANGAILVGDTAAAIRSVTILAEKIFAIGPFIPDPLPENWRAILEAWLSGEPMAHIANESEDEVLQFIEGGLVYRLPWGMEAIRVRALAHDSTLESGLSLKDIELGVAVAAVESGTLNRAAALLIRAGFSSRLSAIKVIKDTSATFESPRQLREWLKSKDIVERTQGDPNWPTPETSQMWKAFVDGFTPPASKIWRPQSHDLSLDLMADAPPISTGMPVTIAHDDSGTVVFSPDLQPIGRLKTPLNACRAGLLVATANAEKTSISAEYVGPNDLFIM